MISQVDKEYLQNLIRYHQLLTQRNALLKQKGRQCSAEELETYDWMMKQPAEDIHTKRADWLSALTDHFTRLLTIISNTADQGELEFVNDFTEIDFIENRKSSLEKDLQLERTTTGPHKDELDFNLNGHSLKKHGSQGQQKSFLLALKLAQYQMMEKRSGQSPLLLLDDIYDRLDSTRVDNLLIWLNANISGQVIITDTDFERIPHHLINMGVEPQIIHF
jgi:DNA replication and repair protein RecF